MLFWIISISILTYEWLTKYQKWKRLKSQSKAVQELREQTQKEYEEQNSYQGSISFLAESPQVHSFFTDLLRTYSEKLAEKKETDISRLPLKFEGFHSDKKVGSGYGEMGYCFLKKITYPFQQKMANISLNRLYLLNKFGCEKYFTSNPKESEDYSYIDISFRKMIDTCSHEIAHYLQLVKWGRSSCESDLILKNGKYDEELAREHKEWTEEIFGMTEKDLEELEKSWKEI